MLGKSWPTKEGNQAYLRPQIDIFTTARLRHGDGDTRLLRGNETR